MSFGKFALLKARIGCCTKLLGSLQIRQDCEKAEKRAMNFIIFDSLVQLQ